MERLAEAILHGVKQHGNHVTAWQAKDAARAAAPVVAAIRDEAKAEAWDEGYRSGHSNAMRRMSDEPDAPTTPNPYRALLDGGDQHG